MTNNRQSLFVLRVTEVECILVLVITYFMGGMIPRILFLLAGVLGDISMVLLAFLCLEEKRIKETMFWITFFFVVSSMLGTLCILR